MLKLLYHFSKPALSQFPIKANFRYINYQHMAIKNLRFFTALNDFRVSKLKVDQA